MSNELIHDVEESLKQERLHELWKEYGPYLIGGVVLAILATAAISGYRGWQSKVNSESTAILINAMSGDNIGEEIGKIDTDLRSGQRAVAKLSEAGAYLQEGQTDKAWMALDEAGSDKDLPAVYRDLAKLEAIRIGWGEKLNETSSETYLSGLKTIYDGAENPWRFHALYQAALINGQDLKDYKAALMQLDKIVTSPAAAPTLIQQAQALKSLYRLENKKAAAAAE